MTGWRSGLLAAALLAATGAASAPVYGADEPVPGGVLFSFQGDDVYESSGLVDRGDVVYTNNDSGDAAVVYGVDPRTGRTVSRTTYAETVTDVEAIAPGASGSLWAGDIGDNRGNRDDIAVYRLDPRAQTTTGTRYPLSYPDGPRDAETLLVQPRTQRVLVVSKSAFGGTVYAAPRDLRAGRLNRMRRFAQVSGLVTDGSFFPDGNHVVLRTYRTASVYTFPGFGLVGTVRLPAQPQGEGISVSRTGRVLVSSEGVRAEVLRLSLPSRLTSSRAPARSPGAAPTPTPRPQARGRPSPRDAGDWTGIALVVAGITGVVVLVRRAAPLRRRRGR